MLVTLASFVLLFWGFIPPSLENECQILNESTKV